MMSDHGEDATELLAQLAVVLGTPCEAAAREIGRETWVRQVHGALRAVQAMCLAGYVWDYTQASAMDRAIELILEQQDTLQDNAAFTESWVAANAMAGAILRHELQPGTVL